MLDYEIISHTADVKLKAYGATREELFSNALNGMFQLMRPIVPSCTIINDRVVCKSLPITRTVVQYSPDIGALLVDFLSSALYLSDVHNEAYFAAEFSSLTPMSVHAQLRGVAIEGIEAAEIKAVTYHDLEVTRHSNGWQAYLVFDI